MIIELTKNFQLPVKGASEITIGKVSNLQIRAIKLPFPEACYISCKGVLDYDNHLEFLEEIQKILEKEIRFFLFDLEGVCHIGNEGIGVLLHLMKILEKLHGDVAFLPFDRNVNERISILGFQPYFKFVTGIGTGVHVFRGTFNKQKTLSQFDMKGINDDTSI